VAARGVALCPTLAASEAIARYGGWTPGTTPEPVALQQKRAAFKAARAAGVRIAAGSDVGVFPHGQNARELELMVAYGMAPLDVLRAATSVGARVLHLESRLGASPKGSRPTSSPLLAIPRAISGPHRACCS
jgi:imidazolonepropionase-like amidohydrolase